MCTNYFLSNQLGFHNNFYRLNHSYLHWKVRVPSQSSSDATLQGESFCCSCLALQVTQNSRKCLVWYKISFIRNGLLLRWQHVLKKNINWVLIQMDRGHPSKDLLHPLLPWTWPPCWICCHWPLHWGRTWNLQTKVMMMPIDVDSVDGLDHQAGLDIFKSKWK